MRTEDISKNPVLNLSFEFAVTVITFCEDLDDLKKYVLSKQLLKSGTSIGANVMEAQNAESKADFIHKMKIEAKESGETQYWLLLCDRTLNHETTKKMLARVEELNRIIGKIIATRKENTLLVIL